MKRYSGKHTHTHTAVCTNILAFNKATSIIRGCPTGFTIRISDVIRTCQDKYLKTK